VPKCQTRPISWTGQPTPQAREAGEWYADQMRRYWATDDDPYYVPALPSDGDGELWPAPNGET